MKEDYGALAYDLAGTGQDALKAVVKQAEETLMILTKRKTKAMAQVGGGDACQRKWLACRRSIDWYVQRSPYWSSGLTGQQEQFKKMTTTTHTRCGEFTVIIL